MSPLSRRTFLSASAAAAAGAAFLPETLRTAMAATAGMSGSLGDIGHIVILMQENRSFDHYYGTLAGVRGFNDPAPYLFQNGTTVSTQPNGSKTILPWHLNTQTTSAQCVPDLDHSWSGMHNAWASGSYNGWVAAKGVDTMGYYTRSDIPFQFALADAFTICDGYHCSVMGPTNPNRLYLWTGMIDPNGTGGGPVTDNSEAGYTWTTYPERLQAATTWPPAGSGRTSPTPARRPSRFRPTRWPTGPSRTGSTSSRRTRRPRTTGARRASAPASTRSTCTAPTASCAPSSAT
jgi:phospholipase C